MQQQLLDAYPAADLAVYVIWSPILPTDDAEAWDGRLLTDPRATHLWDQDVEVGRWLADGQNIALGFHGEIVWDAFLLFGPEATWERSPSDLLGSGAPVAGRIPELTELLRPLLEEPSGKTATPAADRGAPGADLWRRVRAADVRVVHAVS